MAFRGVDYFAVDSLFTEEELMVRQTARRFADERILPVIRDCYRDARFPKELIPEMADLGFFGANLEGYGCAGMSNVEYGLLMQEVERGMPLPGLYPPNEENKARYKAWTEGEGADR